MRKRLSFFILGLSYCATRARKADGFIKGKLVDTAGKQPIIDAAICVLQAKDSSMVTFTLSSKHGAFEVKGLAAGDYVLYLLCRLVSN